MVVNSSHLPFHHKAYVCDEVFKGVKPVLLVTREGEDWCFLCGEGHPVGGDFLHVVGIGHLFEKDDSLREVSSLKPDWFAERKSHKSKWVIKHLDEFEDIE